jgi:hypothetical protein
VDDDWGPELVRPGRLAVPDEPVSSDDELQPNPDWVEIPLVDEEGNEVISLVGSRGEDANSIDPIDIVRLIPRDDLPDGSLKIMGIRASVRSEGTVVGLIRDLRLGDTPNLFMHPGWAQLEAFASLRELRAYPRFVAEDSLSADIAAWGEGTIICTASIYIDVLPPSTAPEESD